MKLVLTVFALLIMNTSFASQKLLIINLTVTEKGFEPNTINVKPGTNLELKITRKTDSTCATQVQVASRNIKKDLPLNKTVSIDIGKVEKGEIKFGCGMNMVTGIIFVK